jgi:hypothetical protein
LASTFCFERKGPAFEIAAFPAVLIKLRFISPQQLPLQFQSPVHAFRPPAPKRKPARSLKGVASMVRAFVVGNFLLGLLLAVASTVFFWAFPLPYARLRQSLNDQPKLPIRS